MYASASENAHASPQVAPDTIAGSSSARADLALEVHVDIDWSLHELFFRRELAKVVGRFGDSKDNLKEVFHLLSEILGLNRGRLFLYDAASGLLTLRYAYGLTRAEIARGVLSVGEGVTGKVFESGQVTIVQDIDSEPNYLWRTVPRSELPNGTTSMFFFPIQVNGRTRGVFNVNRFRGISRSLAADLEILREVATQISQLLKLDDLIAERIMTRTAALVQENDTLKQALDWHGRSYGIIGKSSKMRAAIKQIEQVAGSDATVLLLGESGTGKELFAHAVHLASDRHAGPFIRVNCGAVPEALFESELFGHEKGAFTGATTSRPGRFEEADGGTLFLDEIGDLPFSMQVKLLRTLQERTVSRVGARRERKLDVRIVAATNQDLKRQVAEGKFRLDLFYRIYVVPIQLAPLRERPEDIASLIEHFLQNANDRFHRDTRLTGEALATLIRYPWPGNVRQVQNVVDRLALLTDGSVIDAADALAVLNAEAASVPSASPQVISQKPSRFSVGDELAYTDPLSSSTSDNGSPTHFDTFADSPLTRRIGQEDRHLILAALTRTGGVKSRAAQKLGLTLSQLNYRIRVLGIDTALATR